MKKPRLENLKPTVGGPTTLIITTLLVVAASHKLVFNGRP